MRKSRFTETQIAATLAAHDTARKLPSWRGRMHPSQHAAAWRTKYGGMDVGDVDPSERTYAVMRCTYSAECARFRAVVQPAVSESAQS